MAEIVGVKIVVSSTIKKINIDMSKKNKNESRII